MAGDALELAQAVCTRLCHDLGGPAGALGGALEMLGEAPDEAAELARDAARIIERRLREFRRDLAARLQLLEVEPGAAAERQPLRKLREGGGIEIA